MAAQSPSKLAETSQVRDSVTTSSVCSLSAFSSEPSSVASSSQSGCACAASRSIWACCCSGVNSVSPELAARTAGRRYPPPLAPSSDVGVSFPIVVGVSSTEVGVSSTEVGVSSGVSSAGAPVIAASNASSAAFTASSFAA